MSSQKEKLEKLYENLNDNLIKLRDLLKTLQEKYKRTTNKKEKTRLGDLIKDLKKKLKRPKKSDLAKIQILINQLHRF